MSRYKVLRRSVAALLFSVLLLCSGAVSHSADITFRWAILADSGEGMTALDFSGTPVVHSGTALQVYLEHLSNCHIYLYLLDSGNDLTPLYPEENGYYNYGFPRGAKYIPPGTQSFTFVPPAGTEIFYLIASEQRLFQIERLTEEFINNANSLGQQQLVISEIEAIVDDRQKKSESAEDIERVERKYRTADGIEKTSFNAVEVDISDSYARKLLIDHR